MNNTEIIVQKYLHSNRILVVSLNRPKQLNALNKDLILELTKILRNIQVNNDIDALILTSEITKSFCSGIDVGYVRGLSNEEAADFFYELAALFEMVSALPCITIAAINGYAYGAGADLALACDFRIGGAYTRFSFPGPQFGVVLGTQRLKNEVGSAIARKLVLTGQKIDAEYALQIGLLHEICEEGSCLETALAWARKTSHISKHAQKAIKDICFLDNEFSNPEMQSSLVLARNSVLDGDFQLRFIKYLERVQSRKKSSK